VGSSSSLGQQHQSLMEPRAADGNQRSCFLQSLDAGSPAGLGDQDEETPQREGGQPSLSPDGT
jgi:hypothetical protein